MMVWWIILALIIWASGYVVTSRVLASCDQQLSMIGAPVTPEQVRSRRVTAALWPVMLIGAILAFIGWSIVCAFERSQR